MSIHGAVGGVVKEIKKVPVMVGGVVKEVKEGVCGVGGVVRTFYEGKLMIYDTGKQNIPLKHQDTGNGTVTFGDDKITFNHTTMSGELGMWIKTGDMDLSKYSYFCMDYEITKSYYSYIRLSLKYYKNADDTTLTSVTIPAAVIDWKSTYLKVDITKLDYTYEQLFFEIKSSSSDGSSYSNGYVDGYINKIWLE